jgi:hypothetical protein
MCWWRSGGRNKAPSHLHPIANRPPPHSGIFGAWGHVDDYGIETLRAEAPLHAASTPAAEAVLAAVYRNDVGESNEVMACTPDSDCGEGSYQIYPEDAALRGPSSLRSERGLGERPPMGGMLY